MPSYLARKLIPRLFQPNDDGYHRQHSSRSSTSTTSSWFRRTARSSEFDRVTPQVISGSWIDGRKLEKLLNDKFGSHYKLQVCLAFFCWNFTALRLCPALTRHLQLRSNNYKLYSACWLTDEEIMWCCWCWADLQGVLGVSGDTLSSV